MPYYLPDLPYGGMSELARRVGKHPNTIRSWKYIPVPDDYRECVKREADNIITEHKTANAVRLQYGDITEIAGIFNKSVSTVYNWYVRNIPVRHCRDFLEAVESLDSESHLFYLECSNVAELARRLDKPYTTVYHWLKYGIRDKETAKIVKETIQEIEHG